MVVNINKPRGEKMTRKFITSTIPCASFNDRNQTFLYKNIEGTFLASSLRKNYDLRTNDQGSGHV